MVFNNKFTSLTLFDIILEGDLTKFIKGVDANDAGIVAEKLRRAVDESDLFPPTYKSLFNLSISIGIAMVDGTSDSQKLPSLADTALYAAKDSGRNRVSVVHPDEERSCT
ncbi:MAG: diguanylate cyclase [Firmicutes bacterium]|nr:diguanylate cyclase [Bacillota bacterium]